MVARGPDILLEEAGGRNELAIRNESDRPLVFVIENRNWVKDALTGERVIAMPAFRGSSRAIAASRDNAEIGSIAIMFTDLKGSTELYDALGDAPAYNLVRDHFSFLSDRVQRHHGFVVKTVGDAVMAAFSRPDHAVRAALAIQDDIASFNSAQGRGRSTTPIVLKLGLHAGPCIAVTTGDALDYFGATVNIAARLEHQCRGGEVIVPRRWRETPKRRRRWRIERRSKKRRWCAASARRSGLCGSWAVTKIRKQGSEFGRLRVGVGQGNVEDKRRSHPYVYAHDRNAPA